MIKSIWQGIPAAFGLIFGMMIEITTLIYMGNYGTVAEQGGAGLAISLVNASSFTIAYGLNGAIDTLVSQAFGNKNYTLCGDYLNRGRILLVIFFIPGGIALFFTKQIFLTFG